MGCPLPVRVCRPVGPFTNLCGELGQIDGTSLTFDGLGCNSWRAEGREPSSPVGCVIRSSGSRLCALAYRVLPRSEFPHGRPMSYSWYALARSSKHTLCVSVESRGLHTQEKRRPKSPLPLKNCTLNSGHCQHLVTKTPSFSEGFYWLILRA